MRESNRYHFVDLDVSLPDKSVRQVAVKVADKAEGRAVRLLQAVIDEETAPEEAKARLGRLRAKHELPEGTLVRAFRGARLRRQHDIERVDETAPNPLPAHTPGEVKRNVHVVVKHPDGRTEIRPPAITLAAARRAVSDARKAGALDAFVTFRVWVDEAVDLDATD